MGRFYEIYFLIVFLHFRLTSTAQAPLIQFFYWNVDPFFHLTQYNDTHGSLFESFQLAELHCRRRSYNKANNCDADDKYGSTRKFIEYVKVAVGHRKFLEAIFSPNRLSKVNTSEYRGDCDQPLLQIWGVIFMDKSEEWIDLRLKNLTLFKYTTSEKLALVAKRSSILLTNKILTGISNCTEPIFLSVFMAFIFGTLFWFAEHRENDDVSEYFLTGIQDAAWCCFVSMTTIGYGDVLAKSVIGKFVMWIWITIGLLFIAVICGNVFVAVDNPPDFHAKRITVISNTIAEKYARHNLNAKVIQVGTYREMFSLISDSKADAALMNSDVYSVYQGFSDRDLMLNEKLNCVTEFEVNQPILLAFQDISLMSPEAKELFQCMTGEQNKRLIFDFPIMQNPTQSRVDVVYNGRLNVEYFLYLFLVTLILFIICTIYAFFLGKISISSNCSRSG
uniref:Potassium channel domain-containing protein n=1 Tax=Clytia hemisphaerica TaxID=252671 RepID=A0A7M5XCV8_9CNID